MIFSDEITVHNKEPHYITLCKDDKWELKERQGIYKRYCSYCGSLHPEDMYDLLAICESAEFADRKYGYPHKIYIILENFKQLKFYTKHLIDLKDKETTDKLIDRIKEKTGVFLKSHLDEE